MPAKKLTKADRINKEFKKARIDLGYSQETAAKHFGVKQDTVSKWEKDYTRMSVDKFERYCRYLRLKPSDLLEIERT